MPPSLVSTTMQWILLIAAPLIVWLEEQPFVLAKIALKFQIDKKWAVKRYISLFLRYGYLVFRRLHETIHPFPPQTAYDKLALVLWLKGSAQVNNSRKWLRDQTDQEPKYSQYKDALIHAYKRVLPEKPDTGRPLGNDEIDWVSLGFQGTDPCTDFRAAGLLGLSHFIDFCEHDPAKMYELAKESKSLVVSNDPLWYSLALVSINLSRNLAVLLGQEPLFIACFSGHGTNLEEPLAHFHHQVLIGFHSHWLKEQTQGLVKTVMDTDASISRYSETIPGMLWELVHKIN